MKSIKNSIVTLTVVLAIVSCSELVHTQVEAPALIVDNKSLMADGSSRQAFKVQFKEQLSVHQPLYITTTNGKLYRGPISTSSSGAIDTVMLKPGSTEAMFYLESSLVPDENVIVSASVNQLVRTEKIEFVRSCPDEVKVAVDKSTIDISAGDSIKVELTLLRDDARKLSQLTRVDAVITEHGEMSHTLYADDKGIVTVYIKPKKAGDGTATLTLKTPCAATITPITFTVID